jgi:hypothetical protein
MTDLGKAGLFAIFAFICCVLGILWDIRQMKHQENAKFAIPIALFASSFICAGVGILLFGDYLLGSL